MILKTFKKTRGRSNTDDSLVTTNVKNNKVTLGASVMRMLDLKERDYVNPAQGKGGLLYLAKGEKGEGDSYLVIGSRQGSFSSKQTTQFYGDKTFKFTGNIIRQNAKSFHEFSPVTITKEVKSKANGELPLREKN